MKKFYSIRTLPLFFCHRLVDVVVWKLWWLRWQMDKTGQTLNRLMSYDQSTTQTILAEPTDSAEPWTIRCWPEPCDSNVTHPQPGTDGSRSFASCDFTKTWVCNLGKFEVSVLFSIKSGGSNLASLLTLTFCFSVVLFYFYL